MLPHPPPYKKALLICNLGTPETLSVRSVRRFLRDFLSDPLVVRLPRVLWLPILYLIILPFRSRRSFHAYQQIWFTEGSPLRVYSERLLKKVKTVFSSEWDVRLGMTYGPPSIKAAMDEFKKAGIRELWVLPLYPHYSRTTTACCFQQVSDHLQQWEFQPHLHFIQGYSNHPHYIEVLAQSVESFWETNGRSQKLLMSFHGLPKQSLDKGDPYYCFCHKTARQLAERLNLDADAWQMTFQSRLGRAEWLQPYTQDTLEHYPSQGVESVDVICPGFSIDCLETLEEIALQNKKAFLDAGGKAFHYIPCLNDEDSHVGLIQHLIQDK